MATKPRFSRVPQGTWSGGLESRAAIRTILVNQVERLGHFIPPAGAAISVTRPIWLAVVLSGTD